MNRLPNLDPLRFLLATFVLIFHLPQLCKNQGLPYYDGLSLFHKGTAAVYMFFTLSGFLIIRLIYKEKIAGTFSIRDFYMRRILRIFPLYYLIVFFGFAFYNLLIPFLNIPFESNYSIVEGLLLCIFFLPNVFGRLYEPGGILEILWSIGIEEQFYLLIAPLLFLVPKAFVLRVLLVLLTGYFVLFHLDVFSFLKKFSFVYFFLFFGGIIAILEEKKKLEFLKRSSFVPVVICLLTGLYFTTNLFTFESLWITNLFTSVLFGLFIHTISFNNKKVAVKNKWLEHFGKISYGIYMYHGIALNSVVFLFLKIDKVLILSDITTILLINVFTFILTLIFAHISYTYYETYFLKKKIRFRK